jgi:hypothetical protein
MSMLSIFLLNLVSAKTEEAPSTKEKNKDFEGYF